MAAMGVGAMAGLPLDLDLLFARSEGRYLVRVLRSPAGDGQSVKFAQPFSDLELENLVLKIGSARARTRRGDAAPVTAAKKVGAQLFDAVFAGRVGDCLRRSTDRARAEKSALRIRLRFSDCPELASLPWEFLYDQSDDWFLALSDRTPVLRYLQLPDPPRAMRVTLPLRVLVIRSEPADYPQLDLAAEWALVAEALSDLTAAGLIALTELAVPTLAELRRALLLDTFHAVHYLGHSQYDQKRGGALLFADARGHGVPVTGEGLGVILRDHDSLRLAVLNSCEGGRADHADPFAGVADTLVRRGIPAVIAMQFDVSDEAGTEFAPALYGALAAGRPVDAAVAEARKAIYTVSPVEWATPVLYLQGDDAQLFGIDVREDGSAQAAQARAAPAPGGGSPEAARGAPATDAGPPETSSRAITAAGHVDEAARLHDQHQHAEVEAAYREAIDLDPALARAHGGLGLVLQDLNRHAEAEAPFREAIRLDPALAWARCGLGEVLDDLERHGDAEVAFRAAIRLDHTNSAAYRGLGYALMSLGRYLDAETAYRDAIRLDHTDADAHRGLGAALLDLERHLDAETAYREAIRLDHTDAHAHRGLGFALLNLERYAEAETAYREAIRFDPTDALAWGELGYTLVGLQRLADAEVAYREAIRLNPADAVAQGGLDLVRRDLGRELGHG